MAPRVQQYQVTLTADAQNLKTALGLTDAEDVPFRHLTVQATTADAFLGNEDVTTTTYGLKVEATDGVTESLGDYDSGPIKFSDLWGVGDGAVLHFLGVVF